MVGHHIAGDLLIQFFDLIGQIAIEFGQFTHHLLQTFLHVMQILIDGILLLFGHLLVFFVFNGFAVFNRNGHKAHAGALDANITGFGFFFQGAVNLLFLILHRFNDFILAFSVILGFKGFLQIDSQTVDQPLHLFF